MTTKPNRSLEKLQAQAQDGNLYAQCRLADLYLRQETKEGNHAALLWLRGFVREQIDPVVAGGRPLDGWE